MKCHSDHFIIDIFHCVNITLGSDGSSGIRGQVLLTEQIEIKQRSILNLIKHL